VAERSGWHRCWGPLGSHVEWQTKAYRECGLFSTGCAYQRETFVEAPLDVHQPGEHLLAYWMARYYGFVSATQ